jgi:uncharacterized membrane protein
MKYLVAYAATAAAMLAIDMLWLGVIAKPLYQQGIGHLMSDRPNIPVAALFYAVFPIGLMVFAVTSGGVGATWGRTLLTGALFGFFAYATYDLTNLATLKGWPIGLSIIDTLWGTAVSAVAAAAGKVTFDLFVRA